MGFLKTLNSPSRWHVWFGPHAASLQQSVQESRRECLYLKPSWKCFSVMAAIGGNKWLSSGALWGGQKTDRWRVVAMEKGKQTSADSGRQCDYHWQVNLCNSEEIRVCTIFKSGSVHRSAGLFLEALSRILWCANGNIKGHSADWLAQNLVQRLVVSSVLMCTCVLSAVKSLPTYGNHIN